MNTTRTFSPVHHPTPGVEIIKGRLHDAIFDTHDVKALRHMLTHPGEPALRAELLHSSVNLVAQEFRNTSKDFSSYWIIDWSAGRWDEEHEIPLLVSFTRSYNRDRDGPAPRIGQIR
jgi:hypothetical protein